MTVASLPSAPSPHAGVLPAIVSVLTYALTPVAIAMAVADGVSLPVLYAGRTVLALGMLSWVGQIVRRRWRQPSTARPGDPRRLLLVGGSFYCLQMMLFFASLTRVEVAVAGVLAYVYPVLVAVGGAALGIEALGSRQISALVLSLAGIVLVIGTGASGAVDVLGVMLALASAAAYAVYILSSSGPASRVGPIASSCWVLTGASVISVGLLALMPPSDFPVLAGTGWLMLHGWVLLPIAVTSFLLALTRLGPLRLSTLDTLQPAVTAIAGVLILGERLSVIQVVGAALIVCAAGLALRAGQPPATHAARRA